MEIGFLLKGIVLGFSIAAPVGPIGILCIRRTLAEGRLTGLAIGLGAATADAFYGIIAGFGVTFISSFLLDRGTWLRLIGGGFLCYLGVKTFLAEPADAVAPDGDRGALGAYLSAVFLTLTNPMTILAFVGVFAGLGIADAAHGYVASGLLVLGVFTGSALWWLALTGGVSLFRARFNRLFLRWLNRVSGGVLVLFGLAALAYFF